jgi:hypothetical protein
MSDDVAAAPPITGSAILGRNRITAVLYPLASFAALLLAWQFLVRAFGVPE